MAANPRVTPTGQPVLEPGEVCWRVQEEVSFQMESGGGYPGAGVAYYGSGFAYVTDRRIFLIVHPLQGSTWGIELPFLQMLREQLNLPIFGTKSIVGLIQLSGEGGPARPAEWRIAFNVGGAEEFFSVLRAAIEPVRRDPSGFARRIAVAAADVARTAALQSTPSESGRSEAESAVGGDIPKAYFDPADPSVVFVTVDSKSS